MAGKSCAIVLVGENTANRKWINREIVKAWDKGLGIVGIRIHGLKDSSGLSAMKGANPFDYVTHSPTKRPLSQIVKCYDPPGADSKAKYGWISEHIAAAVEEAVEIRNANK